MPVTSSSGGSLVTIDFHALTPEPSLLTPVQLVASARPNGQFVTTEVEDAQGVFTPSLQDR
jgi:hypothetical protein